MKPEPTQPSDWALYRRLLSYVAAHSGAFLLSIVGFLVYSVANVLLADLTQFLLDSLGEAPPMGMGFVSQAAHWFWPPGDKDPLDYARIAVPIAAVAMGATVLEKHLTLDRNLPGPDHKASLEPDQFTAMVS